MAAFSRENVQSTEKICLEKIFPLPEFVKLRYRYKLMFFDKYGDNTLVIVLIEIAREERGGARNDV